MPARDSDSSTPAPETSAAIAKGHARARGCFDSASPTATVEHSPRKPARWLGLPNGVTSGGRA